MNYGRALKYSVYTRNKWGPKGNVLTQLLAISNVLPEVPTPRPPQRNPGWLRVASASCGGGPEPRDWDPWTPESLSERSGSL